MLQNNRELIHKRFSHNSLNTKAQHLDQRNKKLRSDRLQYCHGTLRIPQVSWWNSPQWQRVTSQPVPKPRRKLKIFVGIFLITRRIALTLRLATTFWSWNNDSVRHHLLPTRNSRSQVTSFSTAVLKKLVQCYEKFLKVNGDYMKE